MAAVAATGIRKVDFFGMSDLAEGGRGCSHTAPLESQTKFLLFTAANRARSHRDQTKMKSPPLLLLPDARRIYHDLRLQVPHIGKRGGLCRRRSVTSLPSENAREG